MEGEIKQAREPRLTVSINPIAAQAKPPRAPPAHVGSEALLRLQAATLAHSEFDAAAVALCGELADVLDALRVSIGIVEQRHSDLVAVSRGGPEQLDGGTAKSILAAMDEAYDQASTIVAPSGKQDRRINRAAEVLRLSHHGSVLTVPIAVREKIVGAITIELADPLRVIDPIATLCEDAAALFGPVLQLMRENERSWIRRASEGLHGLARGRLRPGRVKWIVAASIAALGLAALCLVPADVSVSAPARVEGAVQRVVAAPTNGFLKSALVRPGDAVKEGQVVAELLDRDLQLDYAKLQSEIAQHENAYSASMARSDRANMMIYQAKLSEARAQLELVEQQLQRGQMRSPIDGLVIQGDLTQTLGSPVERGQTMMTIAPRDAYRVIIELDERDILHMKVGQTGRISLSALPWDSLPVRIERITPMASVLDGRNVFEIEARPLTMSKDLRPGLRGVARVDVGHAPPLPVWTRRLSDHVQRFIWRWTP